jgi:ATP-dependent DNA helicase RecG
MPDLLKEDEITELKSSFGDGVIEALTAFANTKGGSVYIGVNDKGNPIKGFTIGAETLQKWINEVKLKTQPGIIPDAEISTIDGIKVGVLSVKEFPVKPVSFKGRYYKRSGNSNHQLSVVEISDLSLQSLQLSWDSYSAHGKTFKDLDVSMIEKFISKVNTAGRFNLHTNVKNSLEKLKLINGNQITNAAWLLFGKGNIGYNVHLGRFKTPTHIIDDKMLNGALFQIVEEIMQYLVAHIKVAFEIKGMPTQRIEIFEYPLPALREIALN